MFGRPTPVVFQAYGARRRRRVPPWLWLLAFGIAAGAALVVVAQERWLPPRLSAAASAELRGAYEQAEAERKRLAAALHATSGRLDAALAEGRTLASQLAAARQRADGLADDVASLVSALPPDPRGGAVQIRAARFEPATGGLSYDIVLAREGARRALSGVLQLVVAGDAEGEPQRVTLEPIAVSVASHEGVRGHVDLPAGFTPRQATVQVLDRAGGRRLGLRIVNVR